MQRVYHALFLLLIPFVACTTNETSEISNDNDFVKIFRSARETNARQMLLTNDNEVILIGNQNYSLDNNDDKRSIQIIKTTLAGIILNEVTYPLDESYDAQVNSAIILNDNSLFLCGDSLLTGAPKKGFYAQLNTSDLSVVKEKFDGPSIGNFSPQAAIQKDDGGILVASILYTEGNNDSLYLTELSESDFSNQWQRSYFLQYTGTTLAPEIFFKNNQQAYLAGSGSVFDDNQFFTVLLTFNSVNVIISPVEEPSPISPTISSYAIWGSNLIVTGTSIAQRDGEQGEVIVTNRLDEFATVQAFSVTGVRRGIANKISNSSDGNYFIIGGSDAESKGGTDIRIWKFNQSGEIIWSRGYGGSDDDFGNDVVELPNGRILLLGTSTFAGMSNMTLMGLDDQAEIK